MAHFGVVPAVALLGFVLVSYGGRYGTVQKSPDRADFVGVAYSTASAVAFAGGRAGSVMVDGYNENGGKPHLRALFAPENGRAIETFDDSERVPLQGVVAWLSGKDLIVTGTACPHLSLHAAIESEGDDLGAICGDTRQQVRHLSLDDGTWTTVEDRLDADLFPLHPSFGDAPYALLGTNLAARIFPDGRTESLDTTALPAAASETPCVGPDAVVTSAASSEPDAADLGLFVLRGSTWTKGSAESPGDRGGQARASRLCTRDGLAEVHVPEGAPMTPPSYDLLAFDASGTMTSASIDPPPMATSSGGPPLTVDGGGRLLAVDSTDGTTFELQSGVWREIDGSMPADGSMSQIVVGSRINWIAASVGGEFAGKVAGSR